MWESRKKPEKAREIRHLRDASGESEFLPAILSVCLLRQASGAVKDTRRSSGTLIGNCLKYSLIIVLRVYLIGFLALQHFSKSPITYALYTSHTSWPPLPVSLPFRPTWISLSSIPRSLLHSILLPLHLSPQDTGLRIQVHPP